MSKKMIAGLVGIILGVILIFMGLNTAASDDDLPEIPNRILPNFVSRSSREAIAGEGTPEYVGGDAYNFIIEAAIRGGEISGATTSRAIYASAAMIARAVYMSAGVMSIAIGGVAFLGELDDKKGKNIVEAREEDELVIEASEEDELVVVASEEDELMVEAGEEDELMVEAGEEDELKEASEEDEPAVIASEEGESVIVADEKSRLDETANEELEPVAAKGEKEKSVDEEIEESQVE